MVSFTGKQCKCFCPVCQLIPPNQIALLTDCCTTDEMGRGELFVSQRELGEYFLIVKTKGIN